MKIKVLTDWNLVMPYKDIWNGILEDRGSDIVFMTLEWLNKWWEYHGVAKKLFILMIIQEEQILGFCPLMKVPAKGYEEIRFIGGDEASCMGIVVKKEFKEKVIREILDYLVDQNEKFLINIHGIFKGTYDYEIIREYMKEKKVDFLETSLKSYYINIDNQKFNDYIKTRFSRGSINTMKRKERRLKRLGDLSFKPIDKDQQYIDAAFDLHDKRWRRKIGSSKFSQGKTRKFFRELTLLEGLPFKTYLDIIDINGRIVSFIYGFEYKSRYTFYRIAHDDNFAIFSPGELVLRKKIEECFKRGIRLFDFGPGFEPYKAAWTKDKVEISGFLFPSHNKFSKLIYKIYHWKWNIRQYLKEKPQIYHFVKYRLGRIKFFFYPKNAKRAIERGYDRLTIKIRDVITSLHWTQDYYIMHKDIKEYKQGEIDRRCRVEEATVDKLELLMDISLMDSSTILRRLLNGEKCLLIYTDHEILCIWLNPTRLYIDMDYSLTMGTKSLCICNYCPNRKETRIKPEILQSTLEFLKKQGYEQCYMAIRKKDLSSYNLLKSQGFKKLLCLKFERHLGKVSYKEYKGNQE